MNVVSGLHPWHGAYQLASLSDGMSMIKCKAVRGCAFFGAGD